MAAAQIWALRVLGPEAIGISSSYIAKAAICASLVMLGLNPAFIRTFVRDESGDSRWQLILSVASMRGLAAILVFFFWLVFELSVNKQGHGLSMFGGVIIFASSANSVSWVLLADRKQNRVVIATLVKSLATLIGFFLVLEKGSLVGTDCLVLGLASLTAFTYEVYYVLRGRVGNSRLRCRVDMKRAARLATSSKFLVATAVVTSLYSQIDLLLVRYCIGVSEAGVYKAALTVAAAINALIVVLHSMEYPRFVESLNRDRHVGRKLIQTTVKRYALAGAGGCVLLIPLAWSGMQIVLGSEYTGVVLLASILIIAKYMYLVGGLYVYALRAIDKDKQVFWVACLGLCLSTSVFLASFRYWGSNAAGASYLFAEIGVLCSAWILWKLDAGSWEKTSANN
ncbi:MAG: oligosaccharide flippase family protein [Aureliella sp.]